MKNIIILVALIGVITRASGQTNTNRLAIKEETVALTNTPPPERTKYDITLGAGGVLSSKSDNSSASLDFSVSANPLANCRNLWFGVSQSFAWKPFSGSTDVDVELQIPVYKDVGFILPAWSVGAAYGGPDNSVWRTGPELIGQYYLSDDSFVYIQANYDMFTSGEHGLRGAVGFGLEF